MCARILASFLPRASTNTTGQARVFFAKVGGPAALVLLPGVGLCLLCSNIVLLGECSALWGKHEQVHMQNMDHLHAYDCCQN